MKAKRKLQAKARQEARLRALSRPELRVSSEPRVFPAGPMAAAMKVEDAGTRRLIDDELVRRGMK